MGFGEGVKKFGNTLTVTSTDISPSTTAYGDGDVMGGILTFSNVVPGDRGGGAVLDAILVDTSTVAGSMDLILFDAEPSSIEADHSTFAPTDAHIDTVSAVFTFSSGNLNVFADNQIIRSSDAEQGFTIEGKDLFGVLVCRTTPTYPTSQTLSIRLKVRRDAV